jgi:hypothetical protein
MADLNLGIDNLYNARLRQRLRELDQFDVITHNPQILGGGPVRKFALAGNDGAYPTDAMRLGELSEMGGARFNLGKALRPVARVLKSKQVRQIAEPVGKALLQAAVQRAVGGKINRLKKAKRWTGYAVDTASKGLDLASKGAKVAKMFGFGEFEEQEGGKINRLKKARRWTNYAADTASKGLDLAAKGATVAKMLGFGEFEDARRVVRKALKEPLVRQAVSRAKKIPVVRRAVKTMTGGKRPPSERALIVKQVMQERGLKMIDASKFVKANGLYVAKR